MKLFMCCLVLFASFTDGQLKLSKNRFVHVPVYVKQEKLTTPSAEIVFQDDSKQTTKEFSNEPWDKWMPQEIPMNLIQELNEARDLADFMNFVDNATVVQIDGRDPEVIGMWDDVDSRFAGSSSSAGVPAKAATCQPENTTVSLVENSDPSVAYYPTCTRIERCGGCCTSKLLVCEPTKTETVLLQVIKTQYTGGSRMTYAGKETLEVQRHLACKCRCRVKESDCNKWQVYDENSCRCRCINSDDRLKCGQEASTRVWDEISCSCRCRETKPCSSGYYYDETSCRCEAAVLSRRVDVALRAAYGEGGRVHFSEAAEDEKMKFDKKKEDGYVEDNKPNAPLQREFPVPWDRYLRQQKQFADSAN